MTINTSSKKRCALEGCNRKIPLSMQMDSCRCQLTFCSKHRLPETHQCTYDFRSVHEKKSVDRVAAMKCVGEKVIKI